VELAPQIQTQDVLVASVDIRQGQALSPENLRWQRWPEESLNASFVQKTTRPDAIDKLKGAVVRSQFIAGEPIRETKLARPESGFMSAILPSGKRAIAVAVSAQNTAGGFILPNDRVDVVQTVTPEGSATVSRTILGNVRVLAIDQTVEEKNGEAVVVGKTATLELDPEQVEVVTTAQATGVLSLSLRSFADTDEVVAAAREEEASTIRIFRAGRGQIVTTN
jgi:pilus assembly protein CpaB